MVEDGRVDEEENGPGVEGFPKPEEDITSGKGMSRSDGHRPTTLIWQALALLAGAIALTVGIMWARTPQAPPQIVTMPNGEKYQFVGVTYGTNHIMGSAAARLVNRLPAPAANTARKYFGKWLGQLGMYQKVTIPSLCVWFQPLGTNASPLSGTTSFAIVYSKLVDENDVEGGTQHRVSLGFGLWPLGEFQVVPRRSPVLQLCFYQADGSERVSRELGRVRFPNPLYGRFPEWKPEPVPAVKKAGDLEVKLDNFMTGVRVSGAPVRLAGGAQAIDYRPGQRGERVETVFDVLLSSSSGTNDYWVMQNATLSDPGGNLLTTVSALAGYASTGTDRKRSGLTPMFGVGDVRKSLPGTLWPDEPAWRLRLEFKHTSQFAAAELVTFKNVPLPRVGATNNVPMTNSVAGVQLVLTQLLRNPAKTNNAWIDRTPETQVRIDLPGRPNGVAVDLVRMTTDAGDEVQLKGNSWGPFCRIASLSFILTNTQTVDITWAVQKMRSVEFLVKPPSSK